MDEEPVDEDELPACEPEGESDVAGVLPDPPAVDAPPPVVLEDEDVLPEVDPAPLTVLDPVVPAPVVMPVISTF